MAINGEIKIVLHNSKIYWKSVLLRDEFLRKPLGLVFTSEQLEEESTQIHFTYLFGKEVKGCLILQPQSEFSVQMRQVVIHEDLQGKGFGKKIILFSEQYAKTQGFQLILCHARLEAVGFYKHLGYKIEGDQFTEVNIPHYKMTKVLTS